MNTFKNFSVNPFTVSVPFVDEEHKAFFENVIHETGTAYFANVAAIYVLSASEYTRTHFHEMIDLDGNFKGLPEDLESEADRDTFALMAMADCLAADTGAYGPLHDMLMDWLCMGSKYAPVLKAAVNYWHTSGKPHKTR